jgi:hypothetical protein
MLTDQISMVRLLRATTTYRHNSWLDLAVLIIKGHARACRIEEESSVDESRDRERKNHSVCAGAGCPVFGVSCRVPYHHIPSSG